MRWTDERVAFLKRRWQAGASAYEIACELGGVSRSAVCGKVNRLGLVYDGPPKKHRPVAAQRARGRERAKTGAVNNPYGNLARKLAARLKKPPKIKARPPKPEPALPPTSAPVTLLALSSIHCRYIIGDACGPATLFCGAPRDRWPGDDASSWCAYHDQFCTTRGRRAVEEVAA